MKVYIAHNFAARDWLKSEVVPMVEAAGHTCTSRWIWDDVHLMSRDQNAVEDLNDIESASSLIIFMDQFGERPGRGKWVEWGFSMGRGKRVILVGTGKDAQGCVFYHLPNMRHADTIEEAIQLI